MEDDGKVSTAAKDAEGNMAKKEAVLCTEKSAGDKDAKVEIETKKAVTKQIPHADLLATLG